MSPVKRKRAVAAAVLIVVLLGAGLFLYWGGKQEPQGFGGISWGSPIDPSTGAMHLIAEDGPLRFYEKSDEEKALTGMAVERVVYGAFHDRFYSAMVYFKSGPSLSELKAALSSRLGEPAPLGAEVDKFVWVNENVTALLTFDTVAQAGRLSYLYRPIQDEVEMSR